MSMMIQPKTKMSSGCISDTSGSTILITDKND